jgi:hypothetical protein
MIGVFVGFSRIFLLGILIFKGLTARRLYMSFDVKGLTAFKHRNTKQEQHEITHNYKVTRRSLMSTTGKQTPT